MQTTMKKLFTLFVTIMAMVVVSCNRYDDTEIWDRINNHEQRIAALEEVCKQLNTNVCSLQTLVEALQSNDYVTSVIPVVKDGETIGYTITFTKSQPITIYHGVDGVDGVDGTDGKDGENGRDGADGYTPQIGVRQDEDNIYYWTIDGEWLLDEAGNRVKAVGVDGSDGSDGTDGKDGANGESGKDGANGADGITPQFKIEAEYWYVSYDGGVTWTMLGRATGEKGDKGDKGDVGLIGDSMFSDVDYSNSDYVVFTLSNGVEIKLPTWYAFEQLQILCNQMNANISALQTIVEALQSNDYVESVTPIVEDGREIGYIVRFTKSGAVTIYHGVDGSDGADGVSGEDGHTPAIGVRKDADGEYYWVVDGEWLLDDAGNRIRAVGTDGADGSVGADGSTPRLKIESGYWYISYDDGKTWSEAGRATGADGTDGDSLFASVTEDAESVYFTLVDGSVIAIRKYSSAQRIDISVSTTDDLACYAGASVEIGYTIIGGDEQNNIECFGNGGWDAAIIKRSSSDGRIRVTAPEHGSTGKVVVLATSGAGGVVMKSLHFDEGVLTDILESYSMGWEASTLAVTLRTNLSYEVHIHGDAARWLTVADTRAEIRTDTLLFSASENDSEMSRTAIVELQSLCGDVVERFEVVQDAQPSAEPIVVGDVSVEFKALGYYSCVEVGEYPDFAQYALLAGSAVLPIEVTFSAEEHGEFVWDVVDSTYSIAPWTDNECVEYLLWYKDLYGAQASTFASRVVEFGHSYELVAIVFDTNGVCSRACRMAVEVKESECGDAADFVAWWRACTGTDDEEDDKPVEPAPLDTPVVSCEVLGNSVTVHWQRVDGAVDYTVTLNGGSSMSVSGNSVVYDELEYSTTYSVSVVANPVDTTTHCASKAGVAQFTTEQDPSGVPAGYIELASCSYVGDYNDAGIAEEFVLRSTDGQNVLYFNVPVALADANYIHTGNYTIGNIGHANYTFNMNKLSGVTIINGIEYPTGVASSSASTMSVVSEGKGGIHEISLTIHISGSTYNYYFKGVISK